MIASMIQNSFSQRLFARFLRTLFGLSQVVNELKQFAFTPISLREIHTHDSISLKHESLIEHAESADRKFEKFPRFILWLCGIRCNKMTSMIHSYEENLLKKVNQSREILVPQPLSEQQKQDAKISLGRLLSKQKMFLDTYRKIPTPTHSYQQVKNQLKYAKQETDSFRQHIGYKLLEIGANRRDITAQEHQSNHQYMSGYYRQLDQKSSRQEAFAKHLSSFKYDPKPADNFENYKSILSM